MLLRLTMKVFCGLLCMVMVQSDSVTLSQSLLKYLFDDQDYIYTAMPANYLNVSLSLAFGSLVTIDEERTLIR